MTGLPLLVLARQRYPSEALADVPGAARRALSAPPWRTRVHRGMRVGVAAGSRGISNYAAVVRTVCDHLKALGADVFIFPCMGSHGGATSTGQIAVLRESGITPETMGVPIRSEIEPAFVGRSARFALEVYMDANAFQADAFLLVNRVKWHTDFAGSIESGLMKMMAMGIGKHKGAQRYHTMAIRDGGYERAIREAAGTVLATGKCLGGVAILEDAYHQTAAIEVVDASELPEKEEELLARVKQSAPKLQVDELDLLIIDEMGKDISGAGMDTKMINRTVHGEANIWPGTKIRRIYVRDLSAHSYGNAVGVGMAEAISQHLYDKIDWAPTRVNALTASTPRNIRLPLVFATDHEAVTTMLQTVGLSDLSQARCAWIHNTLELATLAVTPNLVPELQARIACDVLSGPLPFEFDSEGQMVSPFVTAQVA